ncbi:polysaccharide biosynthesis protein [Echinicola strongylocentroti]|uniref:Polysaccharide biosynthesis protein n=1 Tax=Echinicola strongylocentroti TaxID=1795355 RepID=A0A2Z4IFH6_9BACT|nr:nucleoside-diphosphate sugar epimerase/dehydratase [Echinicola strongylocentroti]AWW29861.1 polysaccharide biosynthesis protein [Echinicola strongylocentroti]
MINWITRTLDSVILFHSIIIAYFLRLNFEWELISAYPVMASGLTFAVLGGSAMVFIESYGWVGSKSRINNIALVAVIVSVALLVTFMLGKLVGPVSEDISSVPLSVLIIAALLAFFTMILYRLLIKEFYGMFVDSRRPKKHIVIFGAGEAGRLSKTVLDSQVGNNQKIHAFLDDDIEKVGDTIGGVPVYKGLQNLRQLKEDLGISDLLISVMCISPKRKKEIIEKCLQLGIKVSIVPSIDEWVKGGFNVGKIRKIKIEDLLSRTEISLDNPAVYHQIHHSVVMVTGAAGSIGSELCRQIIAHKPALLIMVDKAESSLYDIEQEFKVINWKSPVTPILVDIRDKKKMERVFKEFKPDIVYHAAAYKHVPMMENYPEEAVTSNILATKNLADLSVLYNVKQFVFVSTDKAVNPTNVMGASKRIAEIYIQALSDYLDVDKGQVTRFAITRFGNVLGSNGSVIPLFKKQIEQGGPVLVTDPNISRYFMTISEACQLILEAGAMSKGSEIFIFDMGEPVKILELAKKMIQLSDKKIEKDIKIVFTGLREGEKLHEELVCHAERIQVTHHPKIQVVKMDPLAFSKVNYQIEFFERLLVHDSVTDIVRHIKQIVPEYISNTSRYSVLDRMN